MTLGPGTSALEWSRTPGLHALPCWSFEMPARVVVVSPHPDDETLGVGGMISMLVRGGCDVEVIALSDGEAAFPEADAHERVELARVRQREQEHALAQLGLSEGACTRLRIADGKLSEAGDLPARIAARLQGARYCLAPFRADGHPDHEAAGHAAAEACARVGVQLCEYVIWAWHWRSPAAAEFLWSRGHRVALDDRALRAKTQAMLSYASQTSPFGRFAHEDAIVPEAVLAHFRREFEVLLV